MESWEHLRTEIIEAARRAAALISEEGPWDELTTESREELKHDLERLKNLVTSRREPRIVVLGKEGVGLDEILGGAGFLQSDDAWTEFSPGRWHELETARGALRIADLRGDDDDPLKALRFEPPDVILGVAKSEDTELDAVADRMIEALELVEARHRISPPTIAAIFRPEGGRNAGDFLTMQAFKDAFEHRGLGRDFVEVVCAHREERLAHALVESMPDEVRFSLIRLSDDVVAKREWARDIVRIAASLNGTIATVPIPMAHSIPITTVQVLMIAGIAYISGREMSLKTLTEFGAAIGLNVGASMALRELVRLLIHWIPVAGPVVSASIAAGATVTLGKAASRYYLDGRS